MLSHYFGLLLAEGEAAPASPFQFQMLTMIAPIVILFYFMILRPDQKRAASVRTMREGLKKNDRVVTAGGIYGVVTNVQRETNEVTIKVDEANNTRLRVTLDSIARITSEEASGEDGAKPNS